MRVGTDLPEEGAVIDWDIDEIMERESLDLDCYYDWEEMLTAKRADSHYSDVRESIRRWGFIRPLTAYVSDGMLKFGDGHHRLAAAIELGMTDVPVMVFLRPVCAEDSGEWGLSDAEDEVDMIRSVGYDEW